MAVLIGLCGLVLREVFALSRLSSLSSLKADWSLAYASDGQADANKALSALIKHLHKLPSYRSSLSTLASFDREIMNPSDRLALAEKTLLKEADAQAQQLILASAKRATVVTAVSPRALLDMLYVAYESLRLLRGLARLYGVRPAGSVLFRLLKLTLGNLALTGGIALTDGLMEQLLGHGAAAKLSARFGEGVLNGFLIARIGLAAMMACRPVAFHALSQPKISEIAKSILAKNL
jgi:putative membrane protein